MPGTDDGVLVFIRYTVVVREGFGEPVGGADKGCFCVEILEELLVLSKTAKADSLIKSIQGKIMLTSARCCWPVPKTLSFSAVGVLIPLVANSGVLISTEAFVEG